MDSRMLKTLWGLCLATALLPAQAQEVYYIHTDALGSPVAETDANRNVVARFEYEPYGQRIGPGNDDKPGYTGHVMDAVTGLVQMQQRYYDPGIGTFLSVDPVTAYNNPVGQFHRYRYADNNPYKFKDPDGRQSCAGTLCDRYKDAGRLCEMTCASAGSNNPGRKARKTRDWDPAKGRGSDRIDTSDGPRVWVSPTGNGVRGCDGYGCGHNGARRAGGTRQHLGSDFISTSGQTISAPTNGLVERRSNPYQNDPRYTGLQLRTDEGHVIKLWYVTPNTGVVGSEVRTGQAIGTAQDLSIKYTGNMTNHVHERVTSPSGENIDPASITWPTE